MPAAPADDLNRFLTDDGIVALVARQTLRPVDGEGTPFFPPTYLGAGNKPTYCISPLTDGRNLCTVDSVQSQANRFEEALMQPAYRALVRKVEVTATLANGETRTLDMLQLGHRIADAGIQFSTLGDDANRAMRSFASGPDDIARLSPTSLICGIWESRGEGSQLKIPRAFSATITARDVRQLRRMATFNSAFGSAELGFPDKLSELGLDHVPAEEGLGGVVADGPILRTATLNLVALRDNTRQRRATPPTPAAAYIHALGLLALVMPTECFLRQGCLLVPAGARQLVAVARDGSETALTLDHDAVLAHATAAAQTFGIPALEPLAATFQKERVTAAKAKAKAKGAKAK
ncbi:MULTISPECIES: type I-G CRISPR-associated RAMP protein Csb1/Cas7g [Derxia]|uniref:Type I-G CRISPR-associated RAMP protein Csb1/Cas7g n=1 Tax=Derxia gummosa DSM 723 TaxID=1121388 RepID=A0A8B6X9B2_9BURK|nr:MULTISPECIES: type I-U CRISPR-associated RAMP protein Csb1/Cas7u [Derxia]